MNPDNRADLSSEKLAKFLAKCGVASRRMCETYIRAGWVEVNGQTVVSPETRIIATESQVRLQGKIISPPESFRYILFNKPTGVLCTCKPGREKGQTILDLVKVRERIYPVGRLDRDSSGLLLLTNDGEFANLLTHPRYQKEKEYIVETRRAIMIEELEQMTAGIQLDDGMSKFQEAVLLTPSRLKLVLTEGRNRQIRRTLAELKLPILSLHRVRVGQLYLGDLPLSKWRDLTTNEIEILKSGVTKQSNRQS
ncbi:MAG: pseudouridine synthase [bacterium]|nr:pseudouridine synthase [bacterium]